MSVTTGGVNLNGRFANQVIRNLCVSLIAKKYDLYVDYVSYNEIKELGIDLYIGNNKYDNTIELNDNNFFDILNSNIDLKSNINANNHYFQTRQEISDYLFSYLNTDNIKKNIIEKNQFKTRYNNNNDCFLHIRLTDLEKWNPGYDYYNNLIHDIKPGKIYIGSDDFGHEIIKKLVEKYSHNVILLNEYNVFDTIKFGSTNKYIILSDSSLSCIIGYISFYSIVYYPHLHNRRILEAQLFISKWNKIDVDNSIIEKFKIFKKRKKNYSTIILKNIIFILIMIYIIILLYIILKYIIWKKK